MSTNPPPRVIKHFIRRHPPTPPPPKKIVLQPSKIVTHIPPKHEGAPLIHMYRDGGYRPRIRWRVPDPKPVGWLARRLEPRKEEKKREEEGRVKISLEWNNGRDIGRDDGRDRELVRKVEIGSKEGVEGGGGIWSAGDTNGPAPQDRLHRFNAPNQGLVPAASTAKLTANSAPIASTITPALIQSRSIELKASSNSSPAPAVGGEGIGPGGGGNAPIRKYTGRSSKPIEDIDADEDGKFQIRKYPAGGSRPVEYAPAPLPVEPSPETSGPCIRKFLAPDMPPPTYRPRLVPEVKLAQRVLYDVDAQGEVGERNVNIIKYLSGDLTGSGPEPGPRIRKLPALGPEQKESAPSSQRVLKVANLRPMLTELPEGLSWDTVLALVLPEEHILRSRIDTLRRAYDRHYYLGAIPHMKLIYPFLNYPFDTSTSHTSSARLHTAISQHPPFQIHLSILQRLGRAPRSTTSTTGRTLPLLSLHPSPTSIPNLCSLQSSLRDAFSPEINKVIAAGGDMSTGVLHLNSPPSPAPEEWVAYVALGAIKTRRKDLEEVKERFRRGLWGGKGVRAESMWEAERFGVKWDREVKEVEEWQNMVGREGEGEGEGEMEEFKWVVDRVSVLRRERHWDGEEGGLKVVGEIMLGGKPNVGVKPATNVKPAVVDMKPAADVKPVVGRLENDR